MIVYVSDNVYVYSDKYDNDNSNILRILKNCYKCVYATNVQCGSEAEGVRDGQLDLQLGGESDRDGPVHGGWK